MHFKLCWNVVAGVLLFCAECNTQSQNVFEDSKVSVTDTGSCGIMCTSCSTTSVLTYSDQNYWLTTSNVKSFAQFAINSCIQAVRNIICMLMVLNISSHVTNQWPMDISVVYSSQTSCVHTHWSTTFYMQHLQKKHFVLGMWWTSNPNPIDSDNFCKSEIWRYTDSCKCRFACTFCFWKPGFITHCGLLVAVQK